jgi:hypothetical protein
MQMTSNNDVICPNCGSLNAYHARVCVSCKAALIEPEETQLSQPSALAPAPSRIATPQPTRQSMTRVEPLRQNRTAARRVGPAHALANELRAIASGGRAQQGDKGDQKPWWQSLGVAPVLVAFLGMVGLKGDDVLENLGDDDDNRKTLFG